MTFGKKTYEKLKRTFRYNTKTTPLLKRRIILSSTKGLQLISIIILFDFEQLI